jgi:hypothetical protein
MQGTETTRVGMPRQQLLRLDRQRNLRAGREDRDFRLAVGLGDFIGAIGALVVGVVGQAELRQVLAGQRQHARAA